MPSYLELTPVCGLVQVCLVTWLQQRGAASNNIFHGRVGERTTQ
jgi:hypothetical protein